jgi:hypothetical protein
MIKNRLTLIWPKIGHVERGGTTYTKSRQSEWCDSWRDSIQNHAKWTGAIEKGSDLKINFSSSFVEYY